MNFIDSIKERARKDIKTIVLPESSDLRVVKAAVTAVKEKYAKIILIGDEEKIKKIAEENKLDLSGVKFINPKTFELKEKYSQKLYELRQAKGMTIEQASKLMEDEVYLGMMMVKEGLADGLVSGAIHSTSDTLRPALQIIKSKEGIDTVSAFFLMESKHKEFGENGVFIFADCGLNPTPDVTQLCDITIESVNSFRKLVNASPKVALLSYSTKGSAREKILIKLWQY